MKDTHHALPDAFMARMKSQLGDLYDAFLSSLDSPAPTSIHLHPYKRNKHDHSLLNKAVPWSIHGYYLNQRPIFTLDPTFHAGSYYVQEASSMVIQHILYDLMLEIPQPKILDLCASPGGKSTLALSMLDGRGLMVSNETIQPRIPALLTNIEKWGYTNCVVTQADPEKFSTLPDFFDIVMVDAPCSGEGLFRKDLNSRGHWSIPNALQCGLRQKRILHHAAKTLKPGGWLIYSTCTYNPAENTEQIEHLCKEGYLPMIIPGLESMGWIKSGTESGWGYQAYPHRIEGEGFYVSVLRKPMQVVINEFPGNQLDWTQLPAAFGSLIDNAGQAVYRHQDIYYSFPESLIDVLEILSRPLRIVRAGIRLGILKNNEAIPDHHLSLSQLLKPDIPVVDFQYDDAIHYLKKDSLPNKQYPSGYLLARYDDLNLGWLKSIPNRLNNLYPMQQRIMGNFDKKR